MNDCPCDACSLLRWLNDHVGGEADRAISALTQALWRVISESETTDQARIHQSLFELGVDPHTMMMLRTATKLASWELSAAMDEMEDTEEEAQVVLH